MQQDETMNFSQFSFDEHPDFNTSGEKPTGKRATREKSPYWQARKRGAQRDSFNQNLGRFKERLLHFQQTHLDALTAYQQADALSHLIRSLDGLGLTGNQDVSLESINARAESLTVKQEEFSALCEQAVSSHNDNVSEFSHVNALRKATIRGLSDDITEQNPELELVSTNVSGQYLERLNLLDELSPIDSVDALSSGYVALVNARHGNDLVISDFDQAREAIKARALQFRRQRAELLVERKALKDKITNFYQMDGLLLMHLDKLSAEEDSHQTDKGKLLGALDTTSIETASALPAAGNNCQWVKHNLNAYLQRYAQRYQHRITQLREKQQTLIREIKKLQEEEQSSDYDFLQGALSEWLVRLESLNITNFDSAKANERGFASHYYRQYERLNDAAREIEPRLRLIIARAPALFNASRSYSEAQRDGAYPQTEKKTAERTMQGVLLKVKPLINKIKEKVAGGTPADTYLKRLDNDYHQAIQGYLLGRHDETQFMSRVADITSKQLTNSKVQSVSNALFHPLVQALRRLALFLGDVFMPSKKGSVRFGASVEEKSLFTVGQTCKQCFFQEKTGTTHEPIQMQPVATVG